MNILLIDHHELFRTGLRYLLQRLPKVDQILEAGNLGEGLILAEENPDIILLEIKAPQCMGTSAIRTMRQRFPLIRIVVVSSETNPIVISQAFIAGANGYVCKDFSGATFINTIESALASPIQTSKPSRKVLITSKDSVSYIRYKRFSKSNNLNLSTRQNQVLNLLSEGRSNKEIADAIKLSEGTIKAHLSTLFQRLHVKNRTSAVQVAKEMGLTQ